MPRSRQSVSALASAAHGDSRTGVVRRASRHWLTACCLAALSSICPGWTPALAGQYDLGAGFMLGHDSNITRTTDPRAEWTNTWLAGVGYVERTADLTARVLAQVERREFVRNTYHGDTGYFLNGAAVWTIAPQQLSWTVEDLAGESLIELTAPDTPANRARTNSLSTGPELTFRINPANIPVIGARYGRYDIEGPGDNRRYTGYARWLYRLSEPEKLSLNYEAMHVDFTPPALFLNFLRQDQFLRYERVSPLNSLGLEGGTTHIQRYGGDQTNGRLARVAVLHMLTSDAAVRVNLSDQISDAATDLIRGVTQTTSTLTPATAFEAAAVAPLTGSNVATGDVYRSQRGELSYIERGRRIGSNLQGYTRRVDYANTVDQSYREKGGNLTLTWTRSDAVRIDASAEYLKRTFPSLGERDMDRTGILGTTYRLTRGLAASVEIRLMERESNVLLQSFLDRRVMLLLSYSTGQQYSATPRR
jgi:hypothetical protein